MSEGVERSQVVINSAKLRLDLELNSFRALMRRLYGDPAEKTEHAQKTALAMLEAIQKEPPPEKPTELNPIRRHRWALRLRGK